MPSWVLSSLIAMVSITIMMMLFKRLTVYAIPAESINFYFFLLTTFAFLILMILKGTSFLLPVSSIPIFFLLATVAVAFNYFSIVAIRDAPNPGYVEAITSFRLVAISLLSVLLFGSEFAAKHVVGILFVVVGLILVAT